MLADGSVCKVLLKRNGWEGWQFKNEHDCKEEKRLTCELPYKKELKQEIQQQNKALIKQ